MKTIPRSLLLAALACGCKRSAPPPPPEPAPPAEAPHVELSAKGMKNAAIEWRAVKPGTFRRRVRFSGNITGDPKHVALIGARVPGRVTAVRVALGERVKTGQPLFDVDAAELHEATLTYLTATARARNAKDVLGRQKQLVDEKVGAVQELRRAETEVATSEAALQEAKEHLEFLGLSAGQIGSSARSQIRSPIDGQVSTLDVSLGQVLTGNENVVTVADVQDVWASVRVYERDLGSVRLGAKAEIRVPSFADRAFPGAVSFVSDVLEPTSRSAEMRVALDAGGALRPGMSATAYVEREAAPDELWLPIEMLQPHEGATIVFVHTGERRFEVRTVIAGPEEGGLRRVTEGIAPTDEIVVHGAFALRAELERSALEE